uniref:Kazrin, periplakin interacting protein n=1 Tax=Anas platyrhynchos platyrhynchos TaxID=8840 RepID=A0A493SWR4_ANAPP
MKSEQEERAAAVTPGASPRPRRGTAAAGSGDARGRMRPGLAPVALLREEVAQLQEEVHLLRQMKEMLSKDLEETHGTKSPEVLSATELKVQLAQKEQELARAKEALQAMKADRKRLKAEKTDLVSQMQQLYATLESREEQLRDFIRNYEQHRKSFSAGWKPKAARFRGHALRGAHKESEDAVKALAKEKDLLEREKWELRRQAKEATDHASALRSQLDLKDNRMKELEAELAMAKQSLATLTKDVPKRHSLAMPGETVLNGNQEWVLQADLPLTAAIRQSQQTLYHSHPQHSADRQGGQPRTGTEELAQPHCTVSGRPGGPKTEKEEGENGLRLHLAGVRPGQAAQVPRPRALRRHGPRLLHRGGCGLVTPSTAVHPPQPCVCIPLLSCCNFVPPFIPYFFFGGLLFYFCIPVTLPSSSVASFFLSFWDFFFIFFRFLPSFF